MCERAFKVLASNPEAIQRPAAMCKALGFCRQAGWVRVMLCRGGQTPGACSTRLQAVRCTLPTCGWRTPAPLLCQDLCTSWLLVSTRTPAPPSSCSNECIDTHLGLTLCSTDGYQTGAAGVQDPAQPPGTCKGPSDCTGAQTCDAFSSCTLLKKVGACMAARVERSLKTGWLAQTLPCIQLGGIEGGRLGPPAAGLRSQKCRANPSLTRCRCTLPAVRTRHRPGRHQLPGQVRRQVRAAGGLPGGPEQGGVQPGWVSRGCQATQLPVSLWHWSGRSPCAHVVLIAVMQNVPKGTKP